MDWPTSAAAPTTNVTAPSWCNAFRRIPYRDRGRDRTGVDCYGLVALVNREQFGRRVPDYAYASSMDRVAVAGTVDAYLAIDWRKVDAPEPGDLVMLSIAGRPWHCGVYVAPGLMLHAIDGMLSGIDRLDSVRWHRRFCGFYRPVAA